MREKFLLITSAIILAVAIFFFVLGRRRRRRHISSPADLMLARNEELTIGTNAAADMLYTVFRNLNLTSGITSFHEFGGRRFFVTLGLVAPASDGKLGDHQYEVVVASVGNVKNGKWSEAMIAKLIEDLVCEVSQEARRSIIENLIEFWSAMEGNPHFPPVLSDMVAMYIGDEAKTVVDWQWLARDGRAGYMRIAQERLRQVYVKGFTPHDDLAKYKKGELAAAAGCYAWMANAQLNGTPIETLIVADNKPPTTWPWDKAYWKPSHNHERNLEKAGALIAAELDVATLERYELLDKTGFAG